MEGVGARLGRSSTRYGPATVFTGKVRKWTKKWVPLASNASSNNGANASGANGHGNGNGNNQSGLLLYKWTPVSSPANGNGNGNGKDSTPVKDSPSGKESEGATTPVAAVAEEPPRRKYRYIPVSVIEEQKEAAAKAGEENKSNDGDSSQQPAKTEVSHEKPDMNDVAMEEAQAIDNDQTVTEDVKETNLDLSLGLKAHDGDNERDPKAADRGEPNGRSEKASSGVDVELRPPSNAESENRLKRKAVSTGLEMRV